MLVRPFRRKRAAGYDNYNYIHNETDYHNYICNTINCHYHNNHFCNKADHLNNHDHSCNKTDRFYNHDNFSNKVFYYHNKHNIRNSDKFIGISEY